MTGRSPIDPARIESVRWVIAQAWFALQSEYDRISDECLPLSLGDRMVLKMVDERDDIILREIREVLHMPHSTLTSVIDRLERHDLLKRTLTDRDRRSYGVQLTETGKAYMDMHARSERELAVRILDSLGEEAHQRHFVDLLTRVVDGLDHRVPS